MEQLEKPTKNKNLANLVMRKVIVSDVMMVDVSWILAKLDEVVV